MVDYHYYECALPVASRRTKDHVGGRTQQALTRQTPELPVELKKAPSSQGLDMLRTL
jgi:hypothetical protein